MFVAGCSDGVTSSMSWGVVCLVGMAPFGWNLALVMLRLLRFGC